MGDKQNKPKKLLIICIALVVISVISSFMAGNDPNYVPGILAIQSPMFPWIATGFLIFLISYVNRGKLGKWLGQVKLSGLKLEMLKNIRRIPLGWAWLIVVIVGVGVVFYWLNVRPGQIRKECARDYFNDWHYSEFEYSRCLIQHGL